MSNARLKRVHPVTWIRKNLLATPLDIVLTLVSLYIIYLVLPPVVQWTVLDASWLGTTRADCTGAGACWVFVHQRFMQFIYGFYPDAERWRVNVGFVIFGLGVIPLFWRRFTHKAQLGAALMILYPTLGYVLFYGGVLGLTEVDTNKWGGLMLTLIISIVGIVGSLPLGVILALGRRSDMFMIQKLSVIFIEFWRGVPLITVLFMASVMLPLFLPDGWNFDKLLRALVGVTLFSAAYMAEIVRGGLQGMPRGQYEAAAALGLGYWQSMGLVILPQALRKVIPGIVNSFISLFKDTTLVLIIGMFDLLGIVQTATTDPEWLGLSAEGYVFAGLVFWVFCFGLSRFSMRLEASLSETRAA